MIGDVIVIRFDSSSAGGAGVESIVSVVGIAGGDTDCWGTTIGS